MFQKLSDGNLYQWKLYRTMSSWVLCGVFVFSDIDKWIGPSVCELQGKQGHRFPVQLWGKTQDWVY